MPTYEYRCKSCDHRFDAVQSFTDDPITECPQCGGVVKKVFGSVGITFKGSGFYKTDSRVTSPSGDGGDGGETKDRKDGKDSAGKNGSEGSGKGSDDKAGASSSSSSKSSDSPSSPSSPSAASSTGSKAKSA